MKIILSTITLFLFFSAFAQSDSTQNITLHDGGISFHYTLKQRELTAAPYVSLVYKKHIAQLGPVVSVLQEKESNIALNGLQLRYGYNAFSLRKNIDVFLQSTIVYQLSKEEGTGEYFDLSTASFKSFSFDRSSSDLEFYGGYNLVWSLSDKFSVQQSTAYGLIRNSQKSSTDFDSQSIVQNIGSFNVGVGVGYRF